jgi:hypothetical protein
MAQVSAVTLDDGVLVELREGRWTRAAVAAAQVWLI